MARHSLSATATDAAGNTGAHSAALALTVDTNAPTPPVADTTAPTATDAARNTGTHSGALPVTVGVNSATDATGESGATGGPYGPGFN